jgi:serine/threonine-protein kinase
MASVKKRIQGTPDFIAPEQVLKMPLDARTDVFNLGATMYWCLTGKPYPTRLQSQRAGMALNIDSAKEVDTPQECNPQVPGVLSSLVMDCCRNNPGSRPLDMNAVIKKLHTAEHMLQRKAGEPVKMNQRTPSES